MKPCIACKNFNVDPLDLPRYDVLNPTYSPEKDMSLVGPYCIECWPNTLTGSVEEQYGN